MAIAEQEWRLFGQRVDDDPPHPTEADPNDNLQRLPGHWQRIGEYWWLGQNAAAANLPGPECTTKTARNSTARTDYFAWSAAFISYVMRTAGAGPRFPYAPSHYVYINVATDMTLGRARVGDRRRTGHATRRYPVT